MAKKITIRGIIGLSDKATPEFLERELAGAGDVDIKFASPGGLVFPGIEMGNMIKRHPGRTTATMTGLAGSMAAIIPMKADVVLAEDDAIFFIHNVMGGIIGEDFREVNKLGVRLEAMRDLFAKTFSDKTGKPISKMQSLMDDESFFFGEEIVSEGFADSIVPSSSKDDPVNRSAAIALAESEIKSCISTLCENEAKVKEDFEQATAYFNQLTKEVPKPPAAAGKPKEEASIMDLKALLAANPEAKTEHEAAITLAASTARAEGETEGKKEATTEMQASIDSAMPILASADYPQTVKDRVVAKMKAGDNEGLKDFVALHDMNVEAAAATAAAGETTATGETQGQHNSTTVVSEDGMVNNPEQLTAAAAQHKAEYGTDTGGTK